MDFNEKKLMEDDYFKVLKFIASDVFQSKITKLLLWVLLIIQIISTMMTVYSFLFIMDRHEFVNYAPVFFGTFYSTLAVLTLLFKGDIVANIKTDIPMWTIDSAGEEVHSRIKTQIRIITAFILVNFMLASYCGYCYITPLFADKDIFFPLRFFEEYFPDQKNTLSWIYRATFIVMCYVMVVHAYQVIYYTQHLKFQLLLLLEHVSAITKFKKEKNLDEFFYDKDYQNQIHEKLKFCVKRHTEFITIGRNKVTEISYLIGAFSVCGCLLGISIVFFLFSGKLHPQYYIRLGSSCLVACTTFSALILSGQSVENQNDIALMALNEICWYTFNESNKRCYYMMILNASKPIKIKFSENYSINFKLGLAIVNGIYSIMSVMIKMHFE